MLPREKTPVSTLRVLGVVVGGPVLAWAVGETLIPPGQPGTNSGFVLAVLVAVVVAGVRWGMLAA